jgi:Cu-Zn family superoxide dismutase
MIRNRFLVSALLGVTYAGCGSHPQEESASAVTEGSEMASEESARSTSLGSASEARAEAMILGAPDVPLEGDAKFTPDNEGVHAVLVVENATPGKHGVHVHEKGDCSDIPGKSMGKHLSPGGNPHGLPVASVHHLGDMGNIEVGPDGKGKLDIVVKDATLDHSRNSILGKALVVHDKEDIGIGDTGESGTPIACGVIKSE